MNGYATHIFCYAFFSVPLVIAQVTLLVLQTLHHANSIRVVLLINILSLANNLSVTPFGVIC